MNWKFMYVILTMLLIWNNGVPILMSKTQYHIIPSIPVVFMHKLFYLQKKYKTDEELTTSVFDFVDADASIPPVSIIMISTNTCYLG